MNKIILLDEKRKQKQVTEKEIELKYNLSVPNGFYENLREEKREEKNYYGTRS